MAEKTKRYWWLKLREDFFTQKAMKKLRRMPGGDAFTIIYLKMQLASLRNEGALYFDQIEDTWEEELALQLDEDSDAVKMTLLFLRQSGLIEELSDTECILPEAIQNVDSECDSAARMRNMRERNNLLASQCDTETVTCDTEREKEKSEEESKRRGRAEGEGEKEKRKGRGEREEEENHNFVLEQKRQEIKRALLC